MHSTCFRIVCLLGALELQVHLTAGGEIYFAFISSMVEARMPTIKLSFPNKEPNHRASGFGASLKKPE